MQQIHHGAQIAPHRVQQFRSLQLRRQHRERAVANRVVGDRAAFRILIVGVDINAFRKPLPDALHVDRVRKHVVDLRER